MKKSLQSLHRKELKKKLREEAKSLIRGELRRISVTSDNKSFLDSDKAIAHQVEVLIERKKKEKKAKEMSDINNIIKQVLDSNNWGIYFKGEPFQHVPTQDSTSFYKINEIKLENFLDMVHEKLSEAQINKDKQWETRSIDSEERQIDNESLDGSKRM